MNPIVNAVTVPLIDSALEAADAADAARGDDNGPLHGVPFSIKENIDCVGSPTTNGVPAFANTLPDRDAVIVTRMKAAGGIPAARTNLPEMGARLDTDNPLRGRTRNPWNGNLTPGGSSGGEAAALATGMTPFGLGNDIGGSLRNPAYCCGIASLKPTVGRVPLALVNAGDFGGMANALLTDGPMARSVADLRLGLSIMAGRDRRDPQSVDAPMTGPIPDRPRVALVTKIPGCELPAATVAEIERAGRILADRGWEVEEAEPPELDRVNDIWGKVITYDTDVMFAEMKAVLQPAVYDYMVEMDARFDARSMSNALMHGERQRLRAVWSEWLTELHRVRWPDLDVHALAHRLGPRARHGRGPVSRHHPLHHAGQRAGHSGRGAAHGGLGWPGDGRPGLRGALSRGSLPAGRRGDRGPEPDADAHRPGALGVRCR